MHNSLQEGHDPSPDVEDSRTPALPSWAQLVLAASGGPRPFSDSLS